MSCKIEGYGSLLHQLILTTMFIIAMVLINWIGWLCSNKYINQKIYLIIIAILSVASTIGWIDLLPYILNKFDEDVKNIYKISTLCIFIIFFLIAILLIILNFIKI